jgi:hypothetical protein
MRDDAGSGLTWRRVLGRRWGLIVEHYELLRVKDSVKKDTFRLNADAKRDQKAKTRLDIPLERLALERNSQRTLAHPPHHPLRPVFTHPPHLLTRVPPNTNNLPRPLALQVHHDEQLGDLHPRPRRVEVHLQLAVDVGPLGEHKPLVRGILGGGAGV